MQKDTRFQNLTVDYRQLSKLPISTRVDMLRYSSGIKILSSIDPSDLKKLFPDYYLKDEGVAKTLSSLTGYRYSSQATDDGKVSIQRKSSESTSKSRVRDVTPSWMKKVIDVTGIDPRTGEAPTLNKEQKEALNALKNGAISADDPRVDFLKKLSKEDREKAGVETITGDDGKEAFKALPVTVSRQDIEEEHKKAGKLQPGSFEQQSPIIMNRLMKDLNITKEQAAGIIGNLAHESTGLQAGIQEKNPIRGRGGLGWAQWTGVRREAFERYLEQNGLKATDPEANYQFLLKELNSTHRKSLEVLRKTTSVEEATIAFERSYEKAGVKHDASRLKYASRAAATFNPEAGSGNNAEPLTEEKASEIEKRLRDRIEQQRGNYLAEKLLPSLPEGVSENLRKEYERGTPSFRASIHRVIEKLGNGDSSKGVEQLNSIMQRGSTEVQQQILSGKVNYSNLSVEQRAVNMRPDAINAKVRFANFARESGVDPVITSTYRAPTHQIEIAKATPGAHSQGRAFDVRTSGMTSEQVAEQIRALKRAGVNRILLEPDHIHAEVRDDGGFAIKNYKGGNPALTLQQAQEAASTVKHADYDPEEEKKKVESEKQKTEEKQATKQEPEKTDIVPEGTPAFAYGGEMQTDASQLTAVPLDKRDNMAVLDESGKVQFTMNDKERVSLKDGKAKVETEEKVRSEDIKPLQETMKDLESTQRQDDMNRQREIANPNNFLTGDPNETNMMNIANEGASSTENMFKTPSFQRAMLERHFLKDESPMGGNHFSP